MTQCPKAAPPAPEHPYDTDADRRDQAGHERGVAGDRRDRVGVRRDVAGDQRDREGTRRDQVADLRDRDGDKRDESAGMRDALADERDGAGQDRDRAAEQRDLDALRWDVGAGTLGHASHQGRVTAARREAAADRLLALRDREAGASERRLTRSDRETAIGDRSASAHERSRAHADRGLASVDRTFGASERTSSEHDRSSSSADRRSSADERRLSYLDELTGVYSRGAGLRELRNCVDRCRREEQALVVAYVDADGLKATNDKFGHDVGDRLLIRLARALSEQLRSYDIVMRLGGDEFVCVLANASRSLAAERLKRSAIELGRTGGQFTYGLAELRPEDTVNTMLARADAALYAKRNPHGLDPAPPA